MDTSERTRYKQLANDSIIATFGCDDNEAWLARALERCVDELEDANDRCPVCSTCTNHGDHVDESLHIDPSEVLRIHKSLTVSVKSMKDYHIKLSGETADDLSLAEELADLIEEVEGYVDELKEVTLP